MIGGYAEGMPRFLLRDLLLATALISLGMGAFYMLNYEPPFRDPRRLAWVKIVAPALVFSGTAFIGAGVFAPFKKKLLGGFLGLLIPAILVAIFIASSPRQGGPTMRPGTRIPGQSAVRTLPK